MNAKPNPDEKRIWFPAKKFGWGWGPPNCWQGWVVVGIYVGLAMAGAILIEPGHHVPLFIGYLVALTLLLCVVCWRETALALGWKIISFVASIKPAARGASDRDAIGA